MKYHDKIRKIRRKTGLVLGKLLAPAVASKEGNFFVR
jgi:hypothetical protein